jgi:hypothetical protein
VSDSALDTLKRMSEDLRLLIEQVQAMHRQLDEKEAQKRLILIGGTIHEYHDNNPSNS